MKKLLAILLCCAMLCTSLAFGSYAAELKEDDGYTVGDVDKDGTVNAIDSYNIKATLAGAAGAVCDVESGDLDADGQISAMDSYYMKACLSGAMSTSDFESDHNVYRLLIGGYDINEFCIVVPEDATREDNAHYAAERMQYYIGLATGAELEICYGDENRTKEHAIVYNMVALDCELGEELGYEGYKYDVTDGDLNIYGTARGNMYCTYDLLERVGFVFYSDYYTFIWETRRVEICEGESESFVPELSFRMVAGSYFGGGGCEDHFYPQKLNGSQLYRAEDDTRTGTLTGPRFINAHSFGYYWRMATGTYTDDDHLYECWQSGEQKEESDWGSSPPWQPCATSDDDYEKLMLGLDRTITMIEKRGQKFTPYISAMSFSIADNQKGYCSCRNCTKKYRTEGYSGLYIDLTNRAARDIKKLYPEYPTLKLMSIIYDHSIPKTVRPEENVIIFFCGQGCNNHPINSGLCDGNKPLIHKLHNSAVVESLKAWTEYCHEAGAEIWFWYYPTSFLFYMSPCPNVLKLYDDFDFIINECGVDGFYFECGGRNYGFESLKAHLASEFIYDPDMTREEYTQILKDYLYIYYGAGYEYIYEYLEMHHVSGTMDTCYLNNFNYPQEMYDEEYLCANYEKMRELVVSAIALAKDASELEALEKLLVCCDFTGLSAVHTDWYKNGNNVDGYVANYDEMCELIQKYEMRPSTFQNEDGTPEQLDFTDYENSPWDQVA
ncbi:MAG: DUF4838 domain-containing protein [Ruminococcaceae bacterium]|nr:DUF4838 domain-containing protein [Oscillospiraceae bacterium]